jgi:hypothetical protein
MDSEIYTVRYTQSIQISHLVVENWHKLSEKTKADQPGEKHQKLACLLS